MTDYRQRWWRRFFENCSISIQTGCSNNQSDSCIRRGCFPLHPDTEAYLSKKERALLITILFFIFSASSFLLILILFPIFFLQFFYLFQPLSYHKNAPLKLVKAKGFIWSPSWNWNWSKHASDKHGQYCNRGNSIVYAPRHTARICSHHVRFMHPASGD